MLRWPGAEGRLELSDRAWKVLAQAGGNVRVLHRHLREAGEGQPDA
ncbi:hypothetical protein ABZ614_45905 [Streptomyces sp. NPDC013178]